MYRRHRLSESRQLHKVRSQGRSWANAVLVLCTLPNGLDYCRVGFLAGRRVGGATVRNKVKRRMREAMRGRVLAVAPGWDLVWIARAQSAASSYQGIVRSMDSLLVRSGCLLNRIGPA
jgi:ribonuclease P protein component